MKIIDNDNIFLTILHKNDLKNSYEEVHVEKTISTYLVQSVLSRLALMNSLARLFGQPIQWHDMYKNEEGCPKLKRYPSVSISLSHSGDYACAVASSIYKELGVDLEVMNLRKTKLLTKYYHVCKDVEAYRQWTRMEAEFKAHSTNCLFQEYYIKDFYCTIAKGTKWK